MEDLFPKKKRRWGWHGAVVVSALLITLACIFQDSGDKETERLELPEHFEAQADQA